MDTTLLKIFSLILVLLIINIQKLKATENFFDDWSAFNESETSGKRGGIFIQVNQKGLSQIGDFIVQALKISHNASSFKNNSEGLSPEPRIAFRLIKNNGIGAKVFLPNETLGQNVHEDMVVQVMIKLTRNEEDYLMVNVPYCEILVDDFRRGMSSFVTRQLPELDVCQFIANWTRCWNLKGASRDCWTTSAGNLCPWTAYGRKEKQAAIRSKPRHHTMLSNAYDKLIKHFIDFSIDFRLTEDPVISNDYILFPIQGGFLYQNRSANMTLTPVIIDRYPQSNRMFQKIITDHFWNTLFAHIYRQDLISFEEKFSMSLLPMVVRFPLDSLCWNCQVHNKLVLSEAPITKIDSNGMKIMAKFRMDMAAKGFLYSANVMHGHAELNASLVVYVKDGSLGANVTIDHIRVHPGTTGLASYMPVTFQKTLEQWIENRVWPSLSHSVDKAFGALHLSGLCGVNITNMDITYMDGASVLAADFDYNPKELVEMWKQRKKGQYSGNLEEDYDFY